MQVHSNPSPQLAALSALNLPDDCGWGETIKRDPCCWCAAPPGRRPKHRTVEHIVPHSKGGTNAWDNTVGACRQCNTRRRSTPLLHWLLVRVGEQRDA